MNQDIQTRSLDNLFIKVSGVEEFKHIKKSSVLKVYKILIMIMRNI